MKASAVVARIFLWLVAGLLFLALAGFLVVRTSLPVTEGTLEVRGLQAPVTVVRDAHGIPRISAGNAADAYMALGFVHAQDRLWQMEFQRLVAAGRLSEAVGGRSEEHTSELQSRGHLVCRLLLEKKKKQQ